MQDCEGTPQHVYMVDTHANYPPVPRRSVLSKPLPPPPSQGARSCQVLVVMLLFLMISSSAIQAVFLYRLYYPTADADSPSASKLTDDIGCASPPTKAPPKLSKPMAHLTGNGYNIRPGKEALSWTTVGDIVLREMKYRDGELFVKNAGFYFVYSKVFFAESALFDHIVLLKTPTYQLRPIEILKARKISLHSQPTVKSNSYLGGVFHLKKGDCIFVNTTSKIIHSIPSENFFGAFML
ncbi:tumor necrosis factor ligand superfamily member 14 [Gadus chalcogrammus]|uniref:tumor necrosis factor ligand superfamily member 14 n=1 Tax=Gadus chalcogrammus TaxID=1042646 RepID=UPI0024C2D4A4|nr:tumor necrosis factor ligand superfamily member 14 [Gadus chalcogrammus]